MAEEEYNSVLIVNDSADAQITFYLYPAWDVICCQLSVKSKIIRPSENYLHRSKNGFQFKIVARFEDNRPKKTIVELQQWEEDKLFKVIGDEGTSSPTFTEEPLADQVEKRICLRRLQRDKELKRISGGRNFYEILWLDMEKVRKMSKEQQAQAIKSGFDKQMRIWNPDHNGGDKEVAKEIRFAYETLQDEEKRARYNNSADYDSGWFPWLSLKRYKAIIKPECVTEKQMTAYLIRMGLFALSALLTVGGVVLTVYSAGLAAPVLVATGAVFGGGLIGAGLQSVQHTLKKASVVDKCGCKDWSMKLVIGLFSGAVTGGAAAGITAGITGIGSAALESAAVTAGQYVGIGAATGAVGGVASSLATDVGRRFVDGKDVTLRQASFRALCGGVVGAAAGVAGDAVTKASVNAQASATSANLKGEIPEQVAIITGARRLWKTFARTIPRLLTENGTEAVVGCPLQIVGERLDDTVENRSPAEHVVDGLKNVAANAALGAVKGSAAAFVTHACNEVQVGRRLKKESKNPSINDEAKPSGIKSFPRRSRVRFVLDKENREDLHKWSAGKCSATYKPRDNEETACPVPENLDAFTEEPANRELEADDQPMDGKVKYISKGAWLSKMVVTYLRNGERVTEEVRGSGRLLDIPSNARNIEVRFQVRRPFWGDVCKYDRFNKSWFKPYEPHIFRYDTPPIRTFTISGNLWWEAVMRVSNEYHDEIDNDL